MKIINNSKNLGGRQMSGFTLIEMIGVLAVIAILAALLIPKVTTAISDARTTSAVGTYQTLQAAAAGHYSKYTAFNITTNNTIITATTNAPALNYDVAYLLPEGFLEQPCQLKIGTGSTVQLIAGGGNSGAGYLLDGVTQGTANNAYTLELVVTNVTAQDAYDVAVRLDGSLAATNTVGNSLNGGRVVWNSTSKLMNCYVAGR